MKLPNPLVPGFNPDPSVVRVDGDSATPDYYLVTSTFEYLPGIPVYHSTDLRTWVLIGHVITRAAQTAADGVPTSGGIWAPTIRHRDGVFYVIVTDAMGRGTMVFSATDPSGPWSDGAVFAGLDGIDPDLAWDDDGTCYVTFSGLILTDGPNMGAHHGIEQVRVDLATATVLEPPRSMWSGTGLMFPEAPHLYHIGEWWYLMIAEGGTERGHSISIARSHSPAGPFEGCPANPVLSARSTVRPVQNTGHGDLVVAPDGTWSCVMLGMRTRGMTRSFSSLGRETFGTHVEWVDGWPVFDPVELTNDGAHPAFSDDFAGASHGPGPEWIGVRQFPADVVDGAGPALRLVGDGRTMDDRRPTFVGRRQRRLDAHVAARVRLEPDAAGRAAGGLCVRYDEVQHAEIELQPGRAVARYVLPGIVHERVFHLTTPRAGEPAGSPVGGGEVTLHIDLLPIAPDAAGGYEARMSSDTITMRVTDATGATHDVGSFDGRFLSAEVTCSFTGRVIGPYCTYGVLTTSSYQED